MRAEIIKQAEKLQEELVKYRRYLHQNAEIGFELPKTSAFVERTLQGMGYAVEKCGKKALVATLGRGNCILLRADMDALPIREQTNAPYACTSARMHACGHDLHTAILLGVAKLLKENEQKIKGRIAFLFQPAEEILQGAKEVVDSGLLRKKRVKKAISLHVITGTELQTGSFVMQKGIGAPSADYFTIQTQGKGCHGSSPWQGVDPITCAARILLGLQEINARELSLNERAVLSVGSFQGGATGNVIPSEAVLQGTLRAYEESTRERIKKRLKEIAQNTANAFGCKAKVSFQGGCPTLINDEKWTELVCKRLQAAFGKDSAMIVPSGFGGASEDFAYIAREALSVMIGLAAGKSSDGYAYPLHHPKVQFDESVLWRGAAAFAVLALSCNKE